MSVSEIEISVIRQVVENFEEMGDTIIVNCPLAWLRRLLDEVDELLLEAGA